MGSLRVFMAFPKANTFGDPLRLVVCSGFSQDRRPNKQVFPDVDVGTLSQESRSSIDDFFDSGNEWWVKHALLMPVSLLGLPPHFTEAPESAGL